MDALFLLKNVHFLQEILCKFDFFLIIDNDKKISNWRRLCMKNKKMLQAVWWIYIFLLFVIVVVKFNGSLVELKDRIETFSSDGARNYNLIPFANIKRQLTHISEWWALRQILGNIIPFMPFGFLLPLVYRKINSFGKIFITGLLFILFIEFFQLFTKVGSFDVDDILLNSLGIMCGYVSNVYAVGFSSSFCHRKD
jgi:glycopeptide antibiotics resistance protein